jgi:hypothetical protein
MQLTHIGWDDLMERDLYFLAAPDIAALPQLYSFPSQHFAALLLGDTTAVDAGALAAAAQVLVRYGCSYFCAWGPGCERAHDIFDEECLDVPEPAVIMTTWHDDEPLDEALWFFLRTTWPDDTYFDTTRAAIAITIGSSEWAAHVERRMRDIPSLADDVLQEV